MIRVPPPSVSHSCGLSLAYSHQSRVAARRGPVWAEGSGQQHDCASVLVFLSPHLFRLSWHVTMYGPQRHLLAIRRLLVDSVCRGTARATLYHRRDYPPSDADTHRHMPSNSHLSRLAWHRPRNRGQWPPSLVSLWLRSEQWLLVNFG